MSSIRIRRTIVFMAAVAALYSGAFAIRSAAGWAGQTKPLADAPPDAAAVIAQLVDERARAQQLAAQLQVTIARTQELESALSTATDKATHDARAAQHLARQLDAARAKLRDLQTQLTARPAATVTVAVPAPSTAAPSSDGYEGGDDDGEEEHDD
jgi:multidrug efflux pump subunit AcrA (membrane-fusion protein)